MLLWVTTPQAVVRLNKSALPVEEQRELEDIYWNKQKHDSIVDYLHQKLVKEEQDQLFVQVRLEKKSGICTGKIGKEIQLFVQVR